MLLGLLLLAAALSPVARLPLPPLPAYLTAFGTAMVVGNLLLAALLFSRGATECSAGTVQLGSAYLFVGLIFLPLMAMFPGGLLPEQMLGSPASAAWLWVFWHAGFGLAILRYARTQRRGGPAPSLRREVLGCALLVAGLAWLVTWGLPLLPPLLADGRSFFSGGTPLLPYLIMLIDALALAAVLRLRPQGLEQMWLAVGVVAACFDVWLTHLGGERYSLGWYVAKLGSLGTTMAVLFSLFHELTALYRRAAHSNARLAQLVHQDGLTGIANRRHFDAALDNEWLRARRSGAALALLMLDVDQFKQYNDAFGHLAGDDCLRRVAALLPEMARRPGDLAARFGGEEFAVV
ncbi:MAG: diguanylate cyclase, partial [Burkholderiaceae bacterium]